MRLGGYAGHFETPEEWIANLKELNYSAAFCPVDIDASIDEINAYKKAAENNNIIISEVGAWGYNPIHPDQEIREQAIEAIQYNLYLADRIGARCCVAVAGSRSDVWDGHHMDNFTRDTFYAVVEAVRRIIDGVKPKRTWFTLETMPNTVPDSADSYLDLVRSINRDKFAVHMDPVNIISSPRTYCSNGYIIKECFSKLGPWMRSCHAKDVLMTDDLTTHIYEVVPGRGQLDYITFLKQLDKLDPDTPLMIEHLSTMEEYDEAAQAIREYAAKARVKII